MIQTALMKIYDKSAEQNTDDNTFAASITLRFGDVTIPHLKMSLCGLNTSFPISLTITNPDGSSVTLSYLFDRPATFTSGALGIVGDTPNTNSAAIANSTGPLGSGITWLPPYPYNLVDLDNCLYASLARSAAGITQTFTTGSLPRGQRNDPG